MHRIDGAGHVNNMFVAEDVGLSRPPTEVTADILNAFQEELASFITWAGLALSKPDNTQLRQALLAKFALAADAVTLPTIQAGAYVAAAAAGSADAMTASFTPAITTLTHGMVLYVRAAAANATTAPTFSPNGLTARAIVKGANAALVAGDIAGAGHWLALQYDTTLVKWVLLNPATGVAASTTLASSATTQAGVSTTQAVTPAGLAATMVGGVGQAWQVQAVPASRSAGTTFTNSTGRPIMVLIGVTGVTGTPTADVIINSVQMLSWGFPYGTGNPLAFMVPNGATYRVDMPSGHAAVGSWAELR